MNADEFSGIASVCNVHASRLRWAYQSLSEHLPLSAEGLSHFTDMELAICDQFIMRFSKLQDAMGAKLFPAVLELTQENGELNAFIDKLNRLEKIGAISSAADWLRFREMRNQFAHDYPDDKEIQAALLNKAISMTDDLLRTLHDVCCFAERYLHDE